VHGNVEQLSAVRKRTFLHLQISDLCMGHNIWIINISILLISVSSGWFKHPLNIVYALNKKQRQTAL
jgi:hypothetical protein